MGQKPQTPLQNILRTRTGKVSEVLEVEQEMARVREEIESMDAGRKTLEHRVDFAGVDVQFVEEYKAHLDSSLPAFSTRLHNALVTGYRDAVETLVSLVLFLAAYGPTLLVWVALLFLRLRYIVRRLRAAWAQA